MSPFLCEHADDETNKELGTGVCIGIILTGEGPKNMVLWEEVRSPSPSFHAPDELIWVGLYGDDDNDDDEDDDDDDNDDDDNEVEVEDIEEKETIAAKDDDDFTEGNIVDADFSEATIVSNEADGEKPVASP